MGKIKISGIYDETTFSFLQQEKSSVFGFDFNPKSLNFLPGHKLRDILKSGHQNHFEYALQVGSSKEFVIEKIIHDLTSVVSTKWAKEQAWVQVPLDCAHNVTNLDFPFVVEAVFGANLDAVIHHPMLRGISLWFGDIEKENQKQVFVELDRYFAFKQKNPKFKIHMQLDIPENLEHSLFDFFACDYFELKLSRMLEARYRVIDTIKLKHTLDLLKKSAGVYHENFSF